MSVPTEGPWEHSLYLLRNGTAEATYAANGMLRPTSVKAALDLLKGRADQAYDTVNGLTATYETVDSGAPASVTLTGPMGAKVLNFKIPRGPRGLSNDTAVQVAMSQQAGTAMRVGVEAGTVGLLVIADSKGAGTGLTNYVDRWQNRLAALMRARFPITGGDTMRGLIPANMSDPYNAMSGRPTTTGTTYPVDTAGLGYNTLQLELGSTLTFPAATWPAASTLPIGYHTHYGANGTLQVLIDGVVQTEINCAGTGEGAPMRTSIPIAAGAHTVSMRPKAGTAPVRVMYVEQRSASTGWHLYDAARPGLAARHVIDRPGAPQGGSSFAAAVAQLPGVRLTVVALGANDMTISDPARYGRDLRAVVDMVKTAHPLTGVVVVLPAALTDDSAVVDDVSAYHTAARAALVDVPDLSVLAETQLVDLTGPNAPAWLADSVHPNAFGHDVIARALAGSLVGLDGPTDALTMVEAAAAPAVAAAQAAQTSAAQSATDAAESADWAQQAHATSLEPADGVIAGAIGNDLTETAQAMLARSGDMVARSLGWTVATDPKYAGGNDAATLQNAINAAGIGGTVWLGVGKQWVCSVAASSGSVLTLKNFQTIAGGGQNLGGGGTGPSMISFPNLTGTAKGITPASSCTLRDVMLIGPGSAVGSCVGLDANGSNGSGITMERLTFQKWAVGSALTSMFYVKADRCEWRWNTVGLQIAGGYNTTLTGPKFTCSNEATTAFGTGIQIQGSGVRSLTILGGSIENYGSITSTPKRAGIYVVADNSLITLYGVYFETRTTTGQASGVSFAGRTDVTVNATGCMVYLQETRAWIEASSAHGGGINAGGNAFVCESSTTPATPIAYLFTATPDTNINLGVAQMDQWGQVDVGTYCTGGASTQTLRVSKQVPPEAGGVSWDLGRDIRVNGRITTAVGAVVQGARGATASRPTLTATDVGAQYFDTNLGKPIYWNGSAWRDATGTAV